jgi:hypothetical protein
MHQSLQGGQFHIEHVQPQVHGGLTILDNLALACPGCNLKKSDRIVAVDPETDSMVRLFHPRNDRWQDHFEWNQYEVIAKTAIGRGSIFLLEMNHPRRIKIRQAEEMFSLFPPKFD